MARPLNATPQVDIHPELHQEFYPEMFGGTITSGVTDATAAINAAAAAADTTGLLKFVPGKTYKVSGTLDAWLCHVDGTGAKLSCAGAGVVIGNAGSHVDTKSLRLPEIERTASDFAGSSIGLKLVNLFDSNVWVPGVTNFHIGVNMHGNTKGCAYNSLYIGILWNNLINLQTDFEAGGYCNENNYFGGRFGMAARSTTVTAASWSGGQITYTAAGHPFVQGESLYIDSLAPAGYNGIGLLIDSVTATQFKVTAPDPGAFSSGGVVWGMLYPGAKHVYIVGYGTNMHKFWGCSLEGDTVEYAIHCQGLLCHWDSCRFEGTKPQVWFETDVAYANSIWNCYQGDTTLTVTDEADRNSIWHPVMQKYEGLGGSAGSVLARNANGENFPTFIIPGATGSILELDASVSYRWAAGARFTSWKNESDTVDRLRIDGDDGSLYWGSGSATADTDLYRNAANELRTDDSMQAKRFFTGEQVHLDDAAHVVVDLALGSLFEVDLGGSRTIDYPTNPKAGQIVTFLLHNATGGPVTTLWDSGYYTAPAWVDPGAGFFRTITFIVSSSLNLFEISRVTDDF